MFQEMRAEIGPISGICSSNLTIVDDLVARFKSKLIRRGLQVNTMNNYSTLFLGSTYMRRGAEFLEKMKLIYSKIDLYCDERPDYQLGTFISNFANYLSGWTMTFNFNEKISNGTGVHQILFDILENSFKGFENIEDSILLPFLRNMIHSRQGSCGSLMSPLLHESFETFLDMMKHSQVGNTTKTQEERSSFVRRYFNNNPLFSEATLRTKGFTDHMGMMPFCQFGSMSNLTSLSLRKMRECNYFDRIVTPKGFCYSFNSLDMNADDSDSNSDLLQRPTGYGHTDGLVIILNAFEPFSQERESKNFLLSISDDNYPFNILKDNEFVTPGIAYTYKVTANQIVTSPKFDALDQNVRDCRLPHERGNLKISKRYSKSACEYECIIRSIVEIKNSRFHLECSYKYFDGE